MERRKWKRDNQKRHGTFGIAEKQENNLYYTVLYFVLFLNIKMRISETVRHTERTYEGCICIAMKQQFNKKIPTIVTYNAKRKMYEIPATQSMLNK